MQPSSGAGLCLTESIHSTKFLNAYCMPGRHGISVGSKEFAQGMLPSISE